MCECDLFQLKKDKYYMSDMDEMCQQIYAMVKITKELKVKDLK